MPFKNKFAIPKNTLIIYNLLSHFLVYPKDKEKLVYYICLLLSAIHSKTPSLNFRFLTINSISPSKIVLLEKMSETSTQLLLRTKLKYHKIFP